MVDVADLDTAVADAQLQTHDGSPNIRDPLVAIGEFLQGTTEAPYLPSFANAARPDYTGDSKAYVIRNTTSGHINIWSGTEWTLWDGTST